MDPRDLRKLRERLERLTGSAPSPPSPLQVRLQQWEAYQRRQSVYQLPLVLGGQWLRRGGVLYLRHEEPLSPPHTLALRALTAGAISLDIHPCQMVFLDVETTGNGGAGVLPFLIGLGFWNVDQFITEQFLLADPGQEALLLEWIHQRLQRFSVVVTYNGRSFDLPVLQDRLRLHRLAPLTFEGHLDLLHAVRRVVDAPQGYRLTAVEQHLLGWVRDADLPSSWVPRAYFQFLHGRGTTLLRLAVLHHRHDIRVLPRLLMKLDEWVRTPTERHTAADLYKIAKLYFRLREMGLAHRFVEEGLRRASGVDRQRLLKLKAFLHKREKEWHLALQCWQLLVREMPNDLESVEEISKYYEHRARDLHQALLYAWRLPQDREETQRRIQRLYRKIKSSPFRVFPGPWRDEVRRAGASGPGDEPEPLL